MKSAAPLAKNLRIISALMMRETVTRFGREGLGFLWLIGEPLIFCIGVLVMWSLIKPAYEHGVRLGPFVMTGYMCLLLLRHQASFSVGAIQANTGLLYHSQVSILSLFVARNLLEFLGATAAFAVVYVALIFLGQVGLPADWTYLLVGWILMGLISTSFAMSLAALSLRSELAERLVPLISYMLIPLSGAFFMVAWIPGQYRELLLWMPFPHGIEMVRAGVFGEFVETHFRPLYALVLAGLMFAFSFLLLADARKRIDIE